MSGKPRYLQGPKGRKFRRALAIRYGWRCFYCRQGFPSADRITADHYIPRALWPRRYPRQNIVPACSPCNRRKGDRLPLGLVLVLLFSGVKADIAEQPAMREAA